MSKITTEIVYSLKLFKSITNYAGMIDKAKKYNNGTEKLQFNKTISRKRMPTVNTVA